MYLVNPQEPDEGLFYVRCWYPGESEPDETKYESLKLATERMNDLHAGGAFRRIELLQAREWAERSHPKTP